MININFHIFKVTGPNKEMRSTNDFIYLESYFKMLVHLWLREGNLPQE